MPHRATDSRLLAQVLKVDKEYSASLDAVFHTSQASLAALTAYASSCPPTHSAAMMAAVAALSGAEDALKAYTTAVDAWRADLKRVRKCEEVVSNVLRDREILIGKLLKVSHKRSTRDNIGLANQFANEQSLGFVSSGISAGSASTSTLTGGNFKLSHAQAELQACEAHLAEKEKELEDTRQDAIKKGLERRCKALVSCGWTWTERDKSAPNPRQSEQNDSQLSSLTPSLTPSQSASQIAHVASDESPSKSTPQRSGTQERGVAAGPLQLSPTSWQYALDIGPAHGIDDQGNIHESIPTGRPIQPKRTKSGEDSDEEGGQKAPIVIYENKPFGEKSSVTSTPARASSIRAQKEGPSGKSTLRRPHRQDSKARDSPKIGFPTIGPSPNKSKHSSDLGPSRHGHVPQPQPQRSPLEETFNRQQTMHRKRSTSFSILNGITGIFRSRKRSNSAEMDYGLPLSTGGWHTRTDKNLSRSRGGGNSSSEDELPSALVRKSKLAAQATGGSDLGVGSSKRLSKRHLPSITKAPKASASDIQEGSKYTVIERPPRTELTRSDSHSSKRDVKHSSESSRQMARETAANTALNAGTTSAVSRRTSSPPERSKWEDTPEGSLIMNRLQQDDGTRKLSLEPRSSELSEIAERLRRLEEMDNALRRDNTTNSAATALPPAKLEVVKAPPSITQVSSIHDNTASTSYRPESPPATHRSSLRSMSSPVPREQTESPIGKGHSRQKSIGGVADLKARTTASSHDGSTTTTPLKSALKSPKTTSIPLSSLPAVIPNGTKTSSPKASPPSIETPPTPLGAKDGLKVNGDSFFVSSSVLGNRPLSPPTNPSILVPIPRRLSEIPGSARESIITDDGDSSYETPDEDMSGEEYENDRTPNQETPNTTATTLLPATPPRPEPLTVENVNGVSHDETASGQRREGAPVDPSATPSNSTTSNSTSTQTRRKSVRMIIYPTAAVSPPDRYDDELPTPRAEAPSPSPPPRRTEGDDSIRLSGGLWKTRIDTTRNAWEDSSDEDEGYSRAKRALARATEQPEGGGRRR
ncbi:hypothetical protein FRB91_004101 [Serendipita sp. 411]|nr:hypothetical protein FRB91_004101 [Serendipita sp. 411]